MKLIEIYKKLQAAESKLAEMEKQEPVGYTYKENMKCLDEIGSATFFQEKQTFCLSPPQIEYPLYLSAGAQSNADKVEITFEDWLNTPVGLQVRNFDILALSVYEEIYIARLKATFNAKSTI